MLEVNKDLAVADELMAEGYLEHAVAPFARPSPGGSTAPRPARATGSGSPTASWPSIRPPVRTFRRYSSWGSGSLLAGRRPSVRRGPWR
jgi:hypothetical protein